ncbi:flagellar basal body rod protein FlgB [Candidatus Galacturonibacter soehngenii]|uniref:Flagellar basal body rod protein FlgB n=1 Tax=Candidatus Galacturonatibacter soehngenii TaxID=2307010 RepID=A0A7V7UBF5_9FIRM|nr:flagellar basal body rod protein FlgB [Candidatus Galacturonibacter soehngenii]KAB1437715.1 flagellar basal body rod protein FlgB [Candidatus Galacturonibacter soehngenii]MBA4686946.1 flagellar basal body rod protein FlgB [Candidatus Galacturonibacter soehngenii]
MIGSDAFNYINILDKAADASWIRNDVISNNIANATTPNYKRQDVKFEDVLEMELRGAKNITLDNKVSKVSLKRLNTQVYTDSVGYSYRLDGNNVDVETENVELAANYIKYNMLTDSINHEFKLLQAVMK